VETRTIGSRRSTGLGLAFCKLAVEAQGGSIQLESEPGHGATFHLRLPLAPAEGQFPSPAPEAPPAGTAEELRALLRQLPETVRKFQSGPCQQLMTTLRQKTWPKESRNALAELEQQIMTGQLAAAATTAERLFS